MRINILVIMCIFICASIRAQANDWDMTKDQQQEFAEYEERIAAMKDVSKLTNERRGLIRRMMQLKSLQVNAEAQVIGLKTSIEEMRSRLASIKQDKERLKFYENDLNRAQQKIALLRKNGQSEEQTEEEHNEEIADTLQLIDNLQGMVAQQKRRQLEKDLLESKLAKLEPKSSIASKELQDYQESISRLQDELEIVEDKINIMLIPTTAENEFKLWVTIAFTSLVGLVILGFFVVSAGDREVRRAIFSSQSGIQFITLFSLVIAIILFGITEILGAKELAALLGGISGYILGRVSETRMRGGTCQGTYTGGGGPRGGRLSQRGGGLSPTSGLSNRRPSPRDRFSQSRETPRRSRLSQRESGELPQRNKAHQKEKPRD